MSISFFHTPSYNPAVSVQFGATKAREKQKPAPELELFLAIKHANTAVRAYALLKKFGSERVKKISDECSLGSAHTRDAKILC